MASPHLIQKLVLEMDMDANSHEDFHQKDLVEWVQHALLTRLESVLDEMFLGTPQVYVDRLAFDLGSWKLTEFKTELPQIFEAQLRNALIPHRNACRSVAKTAELHQNAVLCVDILTRICLPLLPQGEDARVKEIINQVARIFCEGSTVVDVFDLSKRIIFELADAYPVMDPRQFATIAYPRLKAAISGKENIPTAQSSISLHGEPIENAGIVIAAPYLGHLFQMLHLVENGKFIDERCIQHAMSVLQYTVYGDLCLDRRPGLLEMVLCGVSSCDLKSMDDQVPEEEKRLVDQMLSSIIQHWKALGSTSVQGLRDTFLRHSGWMKKEENAWTLKVHNGPFDVLVDRLPWGVSMVKYEWMSEILRVNWRAPN